MKSSDVNEASSRRDLSHQWILTVCLMLFGIGLAGWLFYYGIHVPFQFRLRGDAWSYMDIAHQWTSFHDALHYAGARSPGFPWFDYLFVSLDAHSTLISKVNHICLTLFILHQFTALLVCLSCVKCRLFNVPSMVFGLLFFVLAAYPPIVMHTTTPLTDVFGMDLLLIGFSLFAWGNQSFIKPYNKILVPLFLGLASGFLLGYAILVRPAYWIGVLGFFVTYVLVIMVNYFFLRIDTLRQSFKMWSMALFTLIVLILPVMEHCKARYHSLCLQDPQTFDAMLSVSAGLSSARTVWSRSDEDLPFLPDPFLVKHFHDRCPISSVTGSLNSQNTNLLSCMYHAPQFAVVYFVKKLTGLFDPFRMTPYTEQLTPVWYVWLARVFSCVAFVGFWILFVEGFKKSYQWIIHRRPVSSLLAATWVFCMIQVAMQSILHIEERYAFPWIPFCILAVFLKVKATQDQPHPSKLRWMWLILSALIGSGYFIQVLLWDKSMG